MGSVIYYFRRSDDSLATTLCRTEMPGIAGPRTATFGHRNLACKFLVSGWLGALSIEQFIRKARTRSHGISISKVLQSSPLQTPVVPDCQESLATQSGHKVYGVFELVEW